MKWFMNNPTRPDYGESTVHTSECCRFVIESKMVSARHKGWSGWVNRTQEQHEVYDRAYGCSTLCRTLVEAKDWALIRNGERRDPTLFPYHFRVLVANGPPSKREVRERINPGREWWMWRADMRMGRKTTTYCQYWFEDARAAVAFRMFYPQAEIVRGGGSEAQPL